MKRKHFPSSSIEEKELSQISYKNEKYIIPSYQREYSWTEKEVNELFDDLIESFEKGIQPQFGNIILLTQDRTNFMVIDGQQRLTTMFLIAHTIKEKFPTKYSQLNDKIEEIYNTKTYYRDVKGENRLSRENNKEQSVPLFIIQLVEKRIAELKDRYEDFEEKDGIVDYFISSVFIVQTFWDDTNFKDSFNTIIDYFAKTNTRGLSFNQDELKDIQNYINQLSVV